MRNVNLLRADSRQGLERLWPATGGFVETGRAPSLQGGTTTVNMHNVPAGVYLLHVTDTNGKTYNRKVVRK